MVDATTKRRNFHFFSRRSSNYKLENEGSENDEGAFATLSSPRSPPPVLLKARSTQQNIRRKSSFSAIEELLQCPICSEKFNIPKMLPCQHTFCQICLIAEKVDPKKYLSCPICAKKVKVTDSSFYNELPSNLYIDSLLRFLVETPNRTSTDLSISTSISPGKTCTRCHIVNDSQNEHECSHCKMIFCRVCWSLHTDDLRTQIGTLLQQLESSSDRLKHKVENYKDHCEYLKEQIHFTADKKIHDINDRKNILLSEIENISKACDTSALELANALNDATTNGKQEQDDITSDDDKKVSLYMNFHKVTAKLLNDISHWGDVKYSLDKEHFRIEDNTTVTEGAEADEPEARHAPFGEIKNLDEENLSLHYRSNSFTPSHRWRKCYRPAGMGVAPWDGHQLFVCATDSRNVLVIDRSKGKVLARLGASEMLYPISIAFLQSKHEIYIADKWKHCLHVFSKDGLYLRSIGSKGNREGCFRSPESIAIDDTQKYIYVCDTGNDRVQVLHTKDGSFHKFIGFVERNQTTTSKHWDDSVKYKCTELNAPTAIALSTDKIVIGDTGNHRIKVYNKNGEKMNEFGSHGHRKGQFRQPEAVAIDPRGFIFVGDSGNARVQIFKSSGQLVRVFGGLGTDSGKFGWISGIHITVDFEIFISDAKNHSINVI